MYAAPKLQSGIFGPLLGGGGCEPYKVLQKACLAAQQDVKTVSPAEVQTISPEVLLVLKVSSLDLIYEN